MSKTENYVIIKILIPVYCAGACIGKDGQEIQRIKSESGARVKVSRNRDLFPRTDERVVLVSGTPAQVLQVIAFVQEKIQNETPPDNRRINPKRKDQVKIIVAHSAAGRIIGRKGDKVNKLKLDFNVKVYITNKDENIPTLNERVVTIEGSDENVRSTCSDIITAIQENPEARLSRSLEYRRFSENPYGGYLYGPPPPPPPPFRGHYNSPPGAAGYGGYSGYYNSSYYGNNPDSYYGGGGGGGSYSYDYYRGGYRGNGGGRGNRGYGHRYNPQQRRNSGELEPPRPIGSRPRESRSSE